MTLRGPLTAALLLAAAGSIALSAPAAARLRGCDGCASWVGAGTNGWVQDREGTDGWTDTQLYDTGGSWGASSGNDIAGRGGRSIANAQSSMLYGTVRAFAEAVADGGSGAYLNRASAYASGGFGDTLRFQLLPGVTSAVIGVTWTFEGLVDRADARGYFSLGHESEDEKPQPLEDYAYWIDKDLWHRWDSPYTGAYQHIYTKTLTVYADTDYFLETGIELAASGGAGVGTYADFLNTSIFSFTLPEGVSFTSASGKLLAGGVSAVPETGSWALMLVGLGAAGGVLRRRRAAMVVGAPAHARQG